MTNPTTPAELSALALERITAHPFTHFQQSWHSTIDRGDKTFAHPCGTTHCWAGHIDLIIGIPVTYQAYSLYNDVKAIMQMDKDAWDKMTYAGNSLARLEAFHRLYFVDSVFGVDGFDADGYDEEGYDRDGYNDSDYDRDGYDYNGYDSNGFDSLGYDADGYDSNGFDSLGYDSDGFDSNGYDSNGYDSNGFDSLGYDSEGNHADD
jgi:hypothetical protein